MSSLSTRLVRLLNMVPYFQANPGISAAEAAADLGVTTKQLMTDLNQLWMCGLPGYSPGDLIDLAFSEESIEVIFSAGMDRPLRLTSPEATAVLVALRALVEVPGVLDREAARSAIAKIESVAAEPQGRRHLAAAIGHQALPDEAAEESAAASAVREAVRLHRALALDYYSASHDTTSHRVVDPIRILFVGDQSYLEAWCRSAEGVRLFRFDRIDSAEVLDEPSAPPPVAVAEGPHTSLFDADPSLPSATLRVAPTATWMFDYFPMRMVGELPDGSCEAQMTYASEEWMARLVLGFGAAVTVLAPSSLAARVRSAAAAALQAYETPSLR